MPGVSSRAKVVPTGQRWYQAKRVPLYIMVAGGWAAAATYLLGNRSQHSGVEVTPSQKNDSLSEEQDGAHKAGKNDHESAGRQASRSAGFHQGQNSDGIFPNAAIAKKLGEVMGDSNKDISKKSDK
ncbi:hypothetical protein ABBQ38_014075 [Trebouxia sp. C0009 RCD-2024]